MAIGLAAKFKGLFITAGSRDGLVFEFKSHHMARTIQRIAHLNLPCILLRRRTDGANTAAPGSDECRSHAAVAQYRRRFIYGVTFGDATKINLYGFTVETNRVGAFVQLDVLVANVPQYRCQ